MKLTAPGSRDLYFHALPISMKRNDYIFVVLSQLYNIKGEKY